MYSVEREQESHNREEEIVMMFALAYVNENGESWDKVEFANDWGDIGLFAQKYKEFEDEDGHWTLTSITQIN